MHEFMEHLRDRLDHIRYNGEYTRLQDLTPCGIMMDSTVRSLLFALRVLSLIHNSAGLIRWKIVIHAFIDGFSRLLTSIRASNNNRASTVLDLFHAAISVHGTPSRVRGDHGTENLEVAEYMEDLFGVDRGSYIWGR